MNSGLEQLIASLQPMKHSEDCSKRSMDSEGGQPTTEAHNALITKSRSSQGTRRTSSEALDACKTRLLDYKELRGLLD